MPAANSPHKEVAVRDDDGPGSACACDRSRCSQGLSRLLPDRPEISCCRARRPGPGLRVFLPSQVTPAHVGATRATPVRSIVTDVRHLALIDRDGSVLALTAFRREVQVINPSGADATFFAAVDAATQREVGSRRSRLRAWQRLRSCKRLVTWGAPGCAPGYSGTPSAGWGALERFVNPLRCADLQEHERLPGVADLAFSIDAGRYAQKVRADSKWISDGECYQINLTFAADFTVFGALCCCISGCASVSRSVTGALFRCRGDDTLVLSRALLRAMRTPDCHATHERNRSARCLPRGGRAPSCCLLASERSVPRTS